MESLTLSDGLPYQRNSHRERRTRGLRLPTPSTSCGSSDSNDEPAINLEMRDKRQAVSSILRSSPDRATPPLPDDSKRATKHKDELNSPNLQHAKPEFITLPPLTSVLNGHLHSPPRTPHRHGAVLPPSLEPSHTTPYHPLTFYPHKKQKIDPGTRPEYGGQPDSVNGIPAHRVHDPQPMSDGHEHSSHASPQQTLPIHRRQDSLVVSPTSRGPPTRYATANDGPAGSSSANLPHHTPEQQRSMSTAFESGFSQPLPIFRGNETSTWHDPPPQPHGPGRSAVRKPNLRSVRSYDTNLFSHSNSPYQHRTRHRTPTHDRYNRSEGLRYERMERVPVQVNSGIAHIPYEYSQAGMYTMSNNYEFQHSKARKRGNLPKQSTEIMKTWFDQNISNPYPSEEQKLHFSNATGVSMTQVSNWFINHRRRCPELRDKRGKSRHGSKDGEM